MQAPDYACALTYKDKRRKNTYGIILVDCETPLMDGHEANKRIRKGEAGNLNNNTFITAMTANARFGDKEKCIQSVMNDYIAKPMKLAEIESSLQECSRQRLILFLRKNRKTPLDMPMPNSTLSVFPKFLG